MRRAIVSIAILVLALAGPERVHARAATPNVVASHYDVSLDLRSDGTLDVVERITIVAGSKPITWFERNVPARHTDGLTDVVALFDGREVGPLQNGVGVRIRPAAGIVRRSSSLHVRWQFAPTANASHTFELRYRALHVVSRETSGPRLQWSALPREHTYPIESARLLVRAPQGTLATAMTAEGGDMQPATLWQDGLLVTRNALAANDGIALDVTFSVDTFRPAEPEWTVIEEHAQRLMPAFLAAGITLLVIGAGTIIMIRLRTRRIAATDDGWAAAPAEPLDAAPAIATALLNRGRTGSPLALQATFFRLVRDGQLVVEQTSGARIVKSAAFAVRRGVLRDAAPHEQWIVDAVPVTGTIDLRRLMAIVFRRRLRFQRAVGRDMTALGLVDIDRLTTARGLRAAGVVLLGVAGVGAAILAAWFVDSLGAALLAMPAAVFIDALAFLIAGQMLETLSDAGERASQQWQQRAAWMRDVVSQRDGDSAPRGIPEFEQWLPFAIGAGLGKRWVKRFDDALRKSGSQIEWLNAMGTAADALVTMDMMIAVSSASHGSSGAGAGAGAGGGSSSAG